LQIHYSHRLILALGREVVFHDWFLLFLLSTEGEPINCTCRRIYFYFLQKKIISGHLPMVNEKNTESESKNVSMYPKYNGDFLGFK